MLSKTIKLAESYLQELEQLQENVFSDAKDKLKNLVGKVGNKLTNLSKDKTQADTSQELTVKKEDIIKKCESIQNSVLESTQAIKKINSGEGQDLKTFIVSFNKGKEPYWSDKAKGMVFTIEIAGSQKQQGKVMNFLTKMANIATNA